MVGLKIKLPDDYLEEEVRCGYTVSKQMKEVWAVQLDLFAEFDRVCRKYGIKYVASGGTLLGAVRHHGYIPWDDDMDLMMTRDQYEKLCRVATKEFTYPYFFQTEETEPGFHRWIARLRNSETTGIQKMELSYHPRYNQGIFIDIFPMDAVPDSMENYQHQLKTYNHYYILYFRFLSIETNFKSDDDTLYKRIVKSVSHLLFGKIVKKLRLTQWAHRKCDEVCQLYNKDNTELISLLSFQFQNLGHAIRRTDMDNIIEVDFEFLKMPVIANYDEHLKRKYGDYMTPTMSPNFHGDVIFDTNMSYLQYYKRIGKSNQ